jgi:type VI secretion system secreted protein VgrG
MRNTFQRGAARIVLNIPFAAFLFSPSVALAGLLGSAVNFAVLGGSAVTVNGGTTTIDGDLGLYPGASISGSGTIDLTGTEYLNDTTAHTALTDAASAYSTLAALAVTQVETGINLSGLALTPGVYYFGATAALTTGTTPTLTLNAENIPNAVFVFQIGSTLDTAASSVVNVINGNAGTEVFWLVGSSATLGASSTFAGNILAGTNIGIGAGTTICGRALVQNVTTPVTLDTNTVADSCATDVAGLNGGLGDFGSLGFAGNTDAGVPEPGTVPLLCLGLLALTLYGWQSRKRVA